MWRSWFDFSTYDDNKFENFPTASDQDDEELLEAWYSRSTRTIQACLANMGIKWAPKEHDIGTKFKRNEGRHQVKAIAIGVSEANPLGESVDCSIPLHSTRILTLFLTLYFKRATPLYPLLYVPLFPILL